MQHSFAHVLFSVVRSYFKFWIANESICYRGYSIEEGSKINWVLIIYSFIDHARRFLMDHLIDTRQSKVFSEVPQLVHHMGYLLLYAQIYFVVSQEFYVY